jgi:peptide chain release factor 3
MSVPATSTPLTDKVLQRRTFAIISHPDAGKTTLTEKLLLYGGAVHLAGSVTAKKKQRAAVSDWMELEKQRGISITSTVLNFETHGFHVNLLDTPGHQDFSEDTYRTLIAADSVIMLIDNAKGVETQTEKLFAVCKKRGIPVVTFINKMDRPGREPLELLDEVESRFGLQTVAMNWPIGMGETFQGVYDRQNNQLHVFERTSHGQKQAPVQVSDIRDPKLEAMLNPSDYRQALEELDILDAAGHGFDMDGYLAGMLSPVFFGSAGNNFGVGLFLEQFLNMAPPPEPRNSNKGEVAPDSEAFSAFVFKIQANMDPQHRDRIAFMRVCSGQFERDMQVKHPRTGKIVRLAFSHRLFGKDRETIDEAYAGDVIGISAPIGLNIGDTLFGAELNSEEAFTFDPMPFFPPECFALLRNPNPSKYKAFQKGIDELRQEGAVQVFYMTDGARNPVLGAVGPLQFDVVRHRLQSEYGVETEIEHLHDFTHVRWLEAAPEVLAKMTWIVNARKATDADDRPVALVKGDWALNYLLEQNEAIRFRDQPV